MKKELKEHVEFMIDMIKDEKSNDTTFNIERQNLLNQLEEPILQWSEEIPKKPGKYIVQTKSPVLKRIKTMDAYLSYPKPRKPHWSFTNQIFYKYLKE